MTAIRKRIPVWEIGGRSRNPTLIASHVELHRALGCQWRFNCAPVLLIDTSCLSTARRCG